MSSNNEITTPKSQVFKNPIQEQQNIRWVIIFLFFSYFMGRSFYLDTNTLLDSSMFWIVISMGVVTGFVQIAINSKVNESVVKHLVIIGDIAFLSVTLAIGGKDTTIFFPIYLWVIVGNAVRYGNHYLIFSTATSILGFLLVILSHTYWWNNLELSIGLLTGLAVVPMYLSKLLMRLNNALDMAVDASNAKSQFLANISHELRTPLNGIIASADLLLEDSLHDDAQKKVSMISNAAQSQMALINDVLDFSKAESGKIQEEKKIASLDDVLDRLVSVMDSQAKAKNLAFEIDIQDQLNQPAWLYPQAMQQVLINLVGNAVKFTTQGKVIVNGRTLIDKDGNELWRFEVVDTGIGISEKAQKTIFDPFVQADETVTRRFGGTGLGTAISKQLVEMMGGEIGCQSIEGEGTTFWFEIPIELADSDDVDEAIERENSNILVQGEPLEVTPPLKVLVADDNRTNRDILEMILVKEGHSVTLVSDGLEALEALRNPTDFDLVILDRNMPEIDGLTVLKLFKENVHGLQIRLPRFMLITADGTKETRELAIQSGVDSFMTKPVRPHELVRTISGMFIFPDENETEKPEETTIESSLRLAVDNTSYRSTDAAKEIINHDVLDQAKLQELDELAEGLSTQMISGFVSDGDRLISDFSDACDEKDLAQILNIAHAMKGSALQLGAKRLADYCKELKLLKRIDLDSKADQTLKDMKYLYLEARNQLIAYSGSEGFQKVEEYR